MQYGHFEAVKQVFAPIDALNAKLNPQLNQFQKQEAQRVQPQIERDLQQIEDNKAKPVIVSMILKELNATVGPLKKTMLIDGKMNALITRVDQFNLEFTGKIPVEEEFLPTFDINAKSPVAWQKPLAKINKYVAEINSELLSGKFNYNFI